MNIPIDEIVVQRDLDFVDENGKKSVQVYLGKPLKDMDGVWFCPYLIEAKSFSRQHRVAGEDSMQALILALKTIPIELEVLAKQQYSHKALELGPVLFVKKSSGLQYFAK